MPYLHVSNFFFYLLAGIFRKHLGHGSSIIVSISVSIVFSIVMEARSSFPDLLKVDLTSDFAN